MISVSELNQLELYRRICNTLFLFGVPAHVKGYRYLISGITLVATEPDYLGGITSRLYPTIGEEYDEKPVNIERSIRNAIDITFDRGDYELLRSYFGSAIKEKTGKIASAEFMAIIAQKIRLEMLKDASN